MTDPSHRVGADPTRDIRLPPLADRPVPPLHPDFGASGAAADESAAPAPEAAEAGISRSAGSEPEPTTSGLHVDQPTDELVGPSKGIREPTLTFEGTASERWAAGLAATPDPAWSPVPPRSGPLVGPRPRAPRERARRWPWVVLTLVPLLIIAGAGVWLLLLLRAA